MLLGRREFVRAAVAAGTASGVGFGGAQAEVALRQHGVAGDGQADDTEALQRAVDAANAAEGALRLPRGTYRLTRPIVIRLSEVGFTSVLGDGTAVLLMDGPGPALHVVGTHEGTAAPSSMKSRVWQRERLPLIGGFEIRGEHPESVGVRLEKTVQATLSNLLVRRCRVGIELHDRNRNLIITHCHVYHNREVGILFEQVDLHQAIIADCHISYNPVAGIKLHGGGMRNFQFVGNDIEYNHDTGGEGSADVLIDMSGGGSFREGTIAGNTIQARPSPGGANVRVLGGRELLTGGLLAITGNLIGSQTVNVQLADCRGVSVTGNSLYSGMERTLVLERCANVVAGSNSLDWNPGHREKNHVDGIRIDGCDGVVISGSILEHCFAGSAEAGGTIEVHDSRDVTIADCQVLDARHRGVVLTDAVRCRVSNSTVVDRRPEGTMRASIHVSGRSRDNVIDGNMVNAGSLDVADGTAVVRDNHEVTV